MPSLANAGTSVASPEHLDPPQLRAHKSLRRRPNVPLNSPSAAQTIKPVGHNGLPSGTASLPPAPVRPLTPPAVASTEDSNTHGAHIATTPSLLSVSDAITPRPSHPPTPETTPPQVAASAQRPALKQLAQSFSSSRADSFRTALEIISDAGTETPSRSARSSSFVTRQSDPSDHSDTRSGETTPIPTHTSNRIRSATPEMLMAESRQDATRNPPAPAPSQKGSASSRIDRDSDTAEHPIYMVGSDADSTDVLPVRLKSVRRQGADSHEPVGGLSIEQFREQIGWPQTEPTTAEPDASRRFSNVSTTSTVEVMIIDSPRSTQRSLRHTEKRSSLRSVSSPLTKSEHTSLVSNVSNPDSQHRLVHKSARITEQDRRSVASEMSISGISTMSFLPPNVEIVPVVVIPERRSSLKSSTSTSRNTSQSRSRHSSRRAPVASGSRPGSLEPPRRKERTLSDASTNADKRARSRGRSDGRPVIPQRNSSLSAPTSCNNSRTTSLTSESLRNHTMAMEQETRKKPAPLPLSRPEGPSHGWIAHDVPEAAKTQSIIIGVEDMSHLRPPSMPYTQVSIPSSSPGVIEISEAKTIAIFPHNNESLLLVEPQSQPTAREQIPDIASQDKPQTPVPSTQFEVESPLKNPRQPPKPPVCQVEPPSPVQDASRQLGAAVSEAEANGRPARRFGSIRRPWMVRPRSDSYNSALESFSLTSVKNRKADNPEIEGRLQPFWRPRRFWDDSETDTSSPNGSPVEDRHHHEPDTVIKNSLGMPQQRTVLEGPPISRNPETRRRLGGHHHAANRGTLVGSSQVLTPEALYSQTSLHHHRFQSLSWWRLRLRAGKVRNLRKRMRRVWQQHGERRREAKREKLKQSIGDAVLVDSSTSPRP
ncbi:uncharacterized protein BO95DRAFT_20275 [Aspergillus brunneoviolaceus CBS 621.78]|uniref:Uncharacterized protein n=1 Tax=Aspergillus brunneoviolaceus CBS 621.78 TaxID=1450534 RepID=A0ACD1FTT7_9EURO|nr:hypothetical protein BO95DRAFT_20275 [Aspergillus brunneoviolaceus CBS 621.78]RAH40320.1 hypothetical protein BO95DRAFT_20275 [Aspergillus brunneoviolaceus CBS 621.78]